MGRTRQVIELPPPLPVAVIEHQVYRGWCSACHTWREAALDLSGQMLGQGRLGVGSASLVARLRTGLRLPVRVIQRSLADLHGLRVSVGELGERLHRVGEGACRASSGGHPGAHPGARGGACRRDRLTRGRGHQVRLGAGHRGGGAAGRLRPPPGGGGRGRAAGRGLQGALVSDFYAGNNDTLGGQHQRCWVHLLRDMHELAGAFTHATDLVGLEVRAWTAAVTTLWQREQVAAELRDEVAALGAQFVAQRDYPCRALAWRLWHFQGELLTCVLQPAVPADNNLAERTIRPQVIARTISGGTRSPHGS